MATECSAALFEFARIDDPSLAIAWPVDIEVMLSERDRMLPHLAAQPDIFAYQP